MATVNKSSLRAEFDALKARFESLCAAGKMSADSRALFDALLMLFELLMAVFMEKHTPKSSANSSLPASQSPNDDTARTRPGAKGKGPSSNGERCANTRTREYVKVLSVDACGRCGEDLTDAACLGHERGLRPGTSNTAAVAGFGAAVQLAAERLVTDAERLTALRDQFETLLQDRTKRVTLNGALDSRLPGASSLTFGGLDADALIAHLPDLDLSAASACHSGTPEPSHVLRSIGLSDKQAYATLRIAVGRTTTLADIKRAACHINETVCVLRKLGP